MHPLREMGMADKLHDRGFLLKNLLDNVTDNIYFKDRDSRFIMVNKGFCEWTGLAPEEVIGKTDFDLFASAHAQEAFDDEQRIVAGGEPLVGIEEKETWPDGRITWVSTSKMPLKNANGETIGTFGVSRDITEHKEAELRAAYYAEKIQRIKDEMEDEVRMAGELQKTFFPNSYPAFPDGASYEDTCLRFEHHYHASGMVSGDFCSIRKLSDTQAGIFLCDVMGHGVRAALGTGLICAMAEELVHIATDPGRYLGRMNELLLPILRQDDMFLYATACYLVVDCSDGTVRCANAGHPSPMFLDATGKDVGWLMEDDSQRGPALAVLEGAEYRTIEKKIGQNDAVILYTDGLYEFEAANGKEFGESRLLEVARRHRALPLRELFPVLINEVRQFSKDGAFDDDVCLVGFRMKKFFG